MGLAPTDRDGCFSGELVVLGTGVDTRLRHTSFPKAEK
jgi:hypothetical protein